MFLLFRTSTRKHGRISKGGLERSLSTNLREKRLSYSFQNHGLLPFTSNTNEIITLDPNKFAERKQRCLRIGNLLSFQPRVLFKFNESSLAYPRLYYEQTHGTLASPRYPQDLKAFLYYYMSPEKPRIGGELRLRVVSSDDPASFERGSDLLRTKGQPWFRPLYSLSKHSHRLYEKLREDQLIPDDLDAVLSNLPSKKMYHRRSQFLYTLDDTFIIDFSIYSSKLFVISERGAAVLRLKGAFSDDRKLWTRNHQRPYTGSALARFERSTLPEREGTRTVVLRLLKIITPVKCVIPLYDGFICCPKEGELYPTNNRSDVWSVNIDEQKRKDTLGRGFQLIWDT